MTSLSPQRIISCLEHRFPSAQRSQATSSLVSTTVSVYVGIPGILCFYFCTFFILPLPPNFGSPFGTPAPGNVFFVLFLDVPSLLPWPFKPATPSSVTTFKYIPAASRFCPGIVFGGGVASRCGCPWALHEGFSRPPRNCIVFLRQFGNDSSHSQKARHPRSSLAAPSKDANALSRQTKWALRQRCASPVFDSRAGAESNTLVGTLGTAARARRAQKYRGAASLRASPTTKSPKRPIFVRVAGSGPAGLPVHCLDIS